MQALPLAHALGDLVKIPCFFIWRLTWDAAKGKYQKTPCEPGNPHPIDAQLPRNWLSYGQAVERLEQMRAEGGVYALGWMFTREAGYWFLDIDNCIGDGGVYSPLAMDWIARFPGCFFEFSSGGTGVHIIGRGEVPEHAKRNSACGAEFYTEARGVAFGLSGEAWGCADTVSPTVGAFAAQYFPPRESGEVGQWDKPRSDWAGPADDAELLRRARASASVAAKMGQRATFEQLWTNAPELADFYGDSERDAALASHLAFWTGCDAPRIERLMRQSALARPKWDEHRRYLRELTIYGACAAQGDVLKDRPRVDVVGQMYGLPPLPVLDTAAPASVAVVAPVISPQVAAEVERLLDIVSASPDWADIHNTVIPAIRAAGIPPALMPRLENAVNKRLDLFDGKLPVAKLRALLNPPREAGVASDDSDVMARPEWAAHYVYVSQQDNFFDLRNCRSLSRSSFGAMYDRYMPIKGDGPGRQSAADFMLQHWGATVVYDTMYQPTEGQFFDYEGTTWANLYSATSVPNVEEFTAEGIAAIEKFQRHLWLLCGQRMPVFQSLIFWMSHNVKHPGVKIRWAPLIKGIEGDGKSTISSVMRAAMGSRNTMAVGPELVCNGGGFTDWAHGQAVLVLEEIYMIGKDRYRAANMIKPQITNNELTVNQKGQAPKKVPNTCNQMAYTNHADAVPLSAKTDRRWLVIFTPFGDLAQMWAALGVTQSRQHFDPIYASLKREPGQWRKWLLDMAIPDTFDIDGSALYTDEKEVMSDSGLDDVEMLLRDIVEDGAYGVSSDCISSACLSRALKQTSFSEGVDLPKGHTFHHMLNRMGYVRVAKQIKWDGVPHRVWVKNGVDAKNNDELRKLLDATKSGVTGAAGAN